MGANEGKDSTEENSDLESANYQGFSLRDNHQLCINQKDREEKGDEVRKMRKCYGDSTVTLISINTKLEDKDNNRENKENRWKATSPDLGTSPPNRGLFQQVNLGLLQALESVKSRNRGNPIDGIYSILGLLPYGEEMKVKYKPKICYLCPNQQETKDCSHVEESKKYPIYTKEELENSLMSLVKLSIKEGYLEPLSWNESIELTETGIRLNGSQHVVNNDSSDFVYSRDGKTEKLFIDVVNKKVVNKLKELSGEVQEQIEELLATQEKITMLSFMKGKTNISTTEDDYMIDIELVEEMLEESEEELKELKEKLYKHLTVDEVEELCQERKEKIVREIIQKAIRLEQENEYQTNFSVNPNQ
nr:11753_t:CDS:2 [Entrophospora candida]